VDQFIQDDKAINFSKRRFGEIQEKNAYKKNKKLLLMKRLKKMRFKRALTPDKE
jgi:hypothetical protein